MEQKREIALPAPLFRDPIYDCPTDPTVIWSEEEKLWYLFYTQRRAGDTAIGVSWVHGTKIGVAVSGDGSRWLYRGTLVGLDIERGHNTFWAPEIIRAEGAYHMYVSYITGIPTDWEYPRQMLHYVSANLWDWHFAGRIDLDSERVIDACVYEIAPHLYKMWYKDENRGSRTCAAVSENLYDWRVLGAEVCDCAQEGPNVFEFGGFRWMVSDYWNGLAVYRSEDFTNWHRCRDILQESGSRPMDVGVGHHADILVREDRAYIFYFCHPYAGQGRDLTGQERDLSEQGRDLSEQGKELSEREAERAVIQAAELRVKDSELFCDRNQPVTWYIAAEEF